MNVFDMIVIDEELIDLRTKIEYIMNLFHFVVIKFQLTFFLANIPILYPLKTPESITFSGAFRGYTIRTLAKNKSVWLTSVFLCQACATHLKTPWLFSVNCSHWKTFQNCTTFKNRSISGILVSQLQFVISLDFWHSTVFKTDSWTLFHFG